MPNPLASTIPNTAMLDADGYIVPVWRAFFQSLFVRTGGGPGVSAGPDVTVALAAETSQRIAGDNTLTAALGVETTARTSADAALSTALTNEAAQRVAGDNVAVSAGRAALGAAIASEQAARILGDATNASATAAIRVLELLVNGDVPVGIMCNPDGTPIYVPGLPP